MSRKSVLKQIAISTIQENPVALRTVDRQSEDYMGLVDSIKTKGFLGAISVREKTDKATGSNYYELVDGLHRYNAAKDAGCEMVNANIVSMDDGQVLEAQIMTNVHKIETKPVEYSRQLLRILSMNPLMTEAELASKLGKSPQWISQRLGLNKITNQEIASLVNEGRVTLANAYALAKLPPEEMADFVDRAMTEAPDTFVPTVQTRVKEIKDAKRKGQATAPKTFVPVAHMQKMADIKSEMDDAENGMILIRQTKVATPKDAWKLALEWILHLDPISVSVQQAKYDERELAKAESKKKRDDLRAAKKAEKVAAEAALAADAATSAEAVPEPAPVA